LLKETTKHDKAKIANLEQAKSAYVRSYAEIKEQFENALSDPAALYQHSAELTTLRTKCSTLEITFKEQQLVSTDLSRQLEDAMNQLMTSEESRENMAADNLGLRTDLNNSRKKLNSLIQDYGANRAKVGVLTHQNDEMTDELAQREAELLRLSKEHARQIAANEELQTSYQKTLPYKTYFECISYCDTEERDNSDDWMAQVVAHVNTCVDFYAQHSKTIEMQQQAHRAQAEQTRASYSDIKDLRSDLRSDLRAQNERVGKLIGQHELQITRLENELRDSKADHDSSINHLHELNEELRGQKRKVNYTESLLEDEKSMHRHAVADRELADEQRHETQTRLGDVESQLRQSKLEVQDLRRRYFSGIRGFEVKNEVLSTQVAQHELQIENLTHELQDAKDNSIQLFNTITKSEETTRNVLTMCHLPHEGGIEDHVTKLLEFLIANPPIHPDNDSNPRVCLAKAGRCEQSLAVCQDHAQGRAR
jgi:chromosome segregation ATPase